MPHKFEPHDIAVIIPAYKPSDRTVNLARELRGFFETVVAVDDGSGAEYETLFAEMDNIGCIVLRHNVNLGKGRALKTAFNWLIGFGVTGAVTADADGQHCFDDIVNCAQMLKDNPDKLIMGCRDFKGSDVPWPNKTGNKITSFVMSALCGVTVSDTQTGLRAMPLDYMKHLMNVRGERYEFETEMLIETRNVRLKIAEQPIKTIYLDNNSSSHYNRVVDSWLIYKKFLKFLAVSLSSTLLDLFLFTLVMFLLSSEGEWKYAITASTVAARVCSSLYNYTLNRKLFKSRRSAKITLVWYAMLAIGIMCTSALLVSVLQSVIRLPAVAVKMVVDFLLYFLGYFVQSHYIFKD